MNVITLAQKYENMKKSTSKHTEMQIIDNNEIVIDCCKSMINYDDNYIKLKLAANSVSIIGLDLTLKNYGANGIIIKGMIKSITFEDETI